MPLHKTLYRKVPQAVTIVTFNSEKKEKKASENLCINVTIVMNVIKNDHSFDSKLT